MSNDTQRTPWWGFPLGLVLAVVCTLASGFVVQLLINAELPTDPTSSEIQSLQLTPSRVRVRIQPGNWEVLGSMSNPSGNTKTQKVTMIRVVDGVRVDTIVATAPSDDNFESGRSALLLKVYSDNAFFYAARKGKR